MDAFYGMIACFLYLVYIAIGLAVVLVIISLFSGRKTSLPRYDPNEWVPDEEGRLVKKKDYIQESFSNEDRKEGYKEPDTKPISNNT